MIYKLASVGKSVSKWQKGCYGADNQRSLGQVTNDDNNVDAANHIPQCTKPS